MVIRELWAKLTRNFENIDYTKITKEELYKNVSELPEMYKKTLKFGKEADKYISIDIAKIEKEMNTYLGKAGTVNMSPEETLEYERLVMLNARMRMVLRATLIPYNVVMGYIRLLTHINSELLSPDSDYITTLIPPYNSLYHISATPLTSNVLLSRQSKSMAEQWLPTRVCFSPTIEQCCIATPFNFNKPDGFIGNNGYKYLHLYEGIPEKGKTRYIRDKIMKHSIGEATITDEIGVTKPIKIKYLGRIKVVYIPHFVTHTGKYGMNIDYFDKRRIISITHE